MQNDPLLEWQRLSEVYRGMYDDELLNLAADANDLTETARQVLDSEMTKRGISPQASGASRTVPEPMRERRAALRADREAPPKPIPEAAGSDQYEAPLEYTWKTVLCECETSEQAQQLAEALDQAGIDNWIELPGRGSRFNLEYSRVLVAADQLEQARAIAAKPIPKEIAEEQRASVPEFRSPVCPKCGAADPILEGVDPFNTWKCEGCGNEWTEPEADLRENSESEADSGAENGKSRPATGQLNP